MAGLDSPTRFASAMERFAELQRRQCTLRDREALQEELLALSDDDVFPHRASVDDGLRDLAQQVGSQCEERGLLVEYMRRHYVDAVQVSAELLRILQGTLRVNAQLRAAVDESLSQVFQGFLGETMRAMQPEGGAAAAVSSAQASPTLGGHARQPGSRTLV